MKIGLNKRILSLEIITSALDQLFLRGRQYYTLRPFLPYLVIPQGECFLPLNRDYKPLGWSSTDWADYKACEPLFFPKELFTGYLEAYPLVPEGACFFFSDNTTPIDLKNKLRYKETLEKLLITNYQKYLKSLEEITHE